MKILLKTILLILLLLYFTTTSSAVPAEPKIFTLEQPDGKMFEAKRWGDEWVHGWETIDNYTIIQNKNGIWTYAIETDGGPR